MPALNGGGLENPLPHVQGLSGNLLYPLGGGAVGSGQPYDADHQLDRSLYSGIAGLLGLEVIRMEQGAQNRPYLIAGCDIGPPHRLDDLLPLLVHLVGSEELEQAGADEAGRRLLASNNNDDVLTVEPAGLAQEGFYTVVVVVVPVLEMPVDATVGPYGVPARPHRHILGVPQGPSGEGPGALLNVLLGVMANTHREKLQKLPAIVLVDCILVIVVVIQPDNHGRVFGQFYQQGRETAQAVPPEHINLVQQRVGLVELDIASGEKTVPEEGQLLFQGASGR